MTYLHKIISITTKLFFKNTYVGKIKYIFVHSLNVNSVLTSSKCPRGHHGTTLSANLNWIALAFTSLCLQKQFSTGTLFLGARNFLPRFISRHISNESDRDNNLASQNKAP